jgi:hypothetical protein
VLPPSAPNKKKIKKQTPGEAQQYIARRYTDKSFLKLNRTLRDVAQILALAIMKKQTDRKEWFGLLETALRLENATEEYYKDVFSQYGMSHYHYSRKFLKPGETFPSRNEENGIKRPRKRPKETTNQPSAHVRLGSPRYVVGPSSLMTLSDQPALSHGDGRGQTATIPGNGVASWKPYTPEQAAMEATMQIAIQAAYAEQAAELSSQLLLLWAAEHSRAR